MLNIALTFSKDDSNALCKTSQPTHGDSIFKLGIDSVPHITLAHLITDPGNAKQFIPLLEENFSGKEFEIEVGDLHISNQKERQRIYYVFKIKNNTALRNLQEKIINLFPDIKLGNPYGENFFGHITLGCLCGEGFEEEDIPNLNPPFTQANAKLCIGSRDSFGRMEKIHKIIT